MIRFSWINLISVMIHLKYLYYNISSLELSCLPHHLCRISLWSTETPVNAILIMFFISFPILPYPIQPHTTITGYTKFIFTTLLVNTISPTISTKIFLHFNWFPSPTPPSLPLHLPSLYVHKIIFKILANTAFPFTSAIFHLPNFAYRKLYNLHQKYFPYLSHLGNSGCVKRLTSRSLVRTDTANLSLLSKSIERDNRYQNH